MIGSASRILRRAAYLSVYDYFALYSPRTYVIAWIPRVALETIFLGLVAQFIGGPDWLIFMLIGFAGYRTLHTTVTFTTGWVAGELYAGTIPLLVGSPTSPLLVLGGRSAATMVHGLTTGLLTIGIAALLGLPLTLLTLSAALGVLVVIELSAYALGVFVGSVALRFPAFANMVGNSAGFTLFAISGVSVPLAALPDAVETIASVLPLAHGLLALREVFGRGDPGVVLSLLGTELAIGLAYTALAVLSFRIFLRRARLQGTLDYH